MFGSLSIAVTGMAAFSNRISITSNNIANLETTGYKASTVNFADMLAQSITRTEGDNAGCGVTIQSVSECWTQGSVDPADTETYLAINGWGMFVVSDPSTDELYYTRDGSFSFNKSGQLVTSDGYVVQGYTVNDDGSIGEIADIDVSYENFAPSPTTTMSTTTNLDADAETGDTFSNTVNVYDSLGNEIALTVTYTKTATAGEWSYEVSIPSEYGSVTSGATGTLTFDSNGELTSGTDPSIGLTLTTGAATQTITWDLYDDSGNTNEIMTQYSSDSIMTDSSQDGYAAGELTAVEIDDSGYVVATYSNGKSSQLFCLCLADFTNYNGLEKKSDNLYKATLDSGAPIYNRPDVGKMGSITSSALESSNVDLFEEMSTLIVSQTAYQACSQAFTTSNEVLQVLINMKS